MKSISWFIFITMMMHLTLLFLMRDVSSIELSHPRGRNGEGHDGMTRTSTSTSTTTRTRTRTRTGRLSFVIQGVTACLPEGAENEGVQIGKTTYVCLGINDRSITVLMPKADEYTRFQLPNSFIQTEKTSKDCDPFWYPNGCPEANNDVSNIASGDNSAARRRQRQLEESLMDIHGKEEQEPHRDLEDSLNLGSSGDVSGSAIGSSNDTTGPTIPLATNFYVESMGVKSVYKKTYRDPSGPLVYPILTAVILVDEGVVTGVIWSDGCYFCPGDSESTDEDLRNTQQCRFNAYNLTTNAPVGAQFLDGLGSTAGFDCGLTEQSCQDEVDSGRPTFCDLNVYIVWTGTDSNGQFFTSAGLRFERFREFSLPSLYTAMQDFYKGSNSDSDSGGDSDGDSNGNEEGEGGDNEGSSPGN